MVAWLKKKFIQLKELTNPYINIYQVVKFTCFDIDIHSESLKCYKYHSECWKCYKVAPVTVGLLSTENMIAMDLLRGLMASRFIIA